MGQEEVKREWGWNKRGITIKRERERKRVCGMLLHTLTHTPKKGTDMHTHLLSWLTYIYEALKM